LRAFSNNPRGFDELTASFEETGSPFFDFKAFQTVEDFTLRRGIMTLLSRQEMDAREISQALGLKEKEVYEHLVHVERSVTSSGAKFIVTPCQCLLCGYLFEDRRRLTRPSRCPQCKRSKLQNPSFRIA
jgi:predicted Zn-ribbon and HTH transcriptional regulator